MSEGAGDRPGLVALAGGDRPVPCGRIRTVRAELVNLAGNRIAVADLVVDDRLPEILMFEGEPFLRTSRADKTEFHQVRPYRVDAMVISEGTR